MIGDFLQGPPGMTFDRRRARARGKRGSLEDMENSTGFLEKAEALFASMDSAYDRAAGHYGFNCEGCDDNCCLTRFYHHTLLEYHLIRRGVSGLPSKKRAEIIRSAERVVRKSALLERRGEPVRLMCPLNFEGRCCLYRERPMICRMHGISHELRKPGAGRVQGEGCTAFESRCGGKTYLEFDRTPFYMEMAQLEQAFRLNLGEGGKFRKTIAEMLVAMAPEIS